MWGQKIDPLAYLESFHQPCIHCNACDSGFGNSKKVCYILMFVPADLRPKHFTGSKVGPGWTWPGKESSD